MTRDNQSRSTSKKLMRIFIAASIVGMLFAGLVSPAAAAQGPEADSACGVSEENLEIEQPESVTTHKVSHVGAVDAGNVQDQNAETSNFNAKESSLLKEDVAEQNLQMENFEGDYNAQSAVVLQSNSSSDVGFCDIKYIGSFINAAFTVFISGALVLGLMTWVVTSFTESLPLPQDIKTTLKKQRNNSVASMLRAVFVPAIIITLLDATDLVIPECISILPF